MTSFTDEIAILIKKEFLENCSPEEVYKYLKLFNKKNKLNLYQEQVDALELKLLNRNDPIINLGLAQYAFNPKVISKLFKTGNNILRLAALTNKNATYKNLLDRSWLDDDILQNIILNEEVDEQRALFTNSSIDSALLTMLYEKKELFANLDDDIWRKLILYTSENKRLLKEYDSEWLSEYAEYLYDKVFSAAWNLAINVPVTEAWAYTLQYLFNNTVKQSSIDIEAAITRWTVKEDNNSKSKFALVRLALARLYTFYSDEFKALKDSADWSKRMAFYERFNCENVEELNEYFERDKEDFLDFSIRNEQLYKNSHIRSRLSELTYKAKGDDLLYVNSFRIFKNKMEKKYPDGFDENNSSNFSKTYTLESLEISLNNFKSKYEKALGLISKTLILILIGIIIIVINLLSK